MELQVEVNVEDQFWDTEGDGMTQAPISPQIWQLWIQQWLKILSTDLPPAWAYELSLCWAGDLTIQALNGQYRHQDQPTDVLAFAALEVNFPQLSELQQTQPLYLGDIIISVETASRQAQQQGHSLTTELAWLVAHGCLHLLGWDHPDQESLNRMMDQQVTLLRTVQLNPKWVNDRSR